MKISIVIPAHNEALNIPVLVARILSAVPIEYEYEIILVDDGSTDHTLGVIKACAKDYRQVRYLSLSRRFGHQAALRAGLTHASGDCVISMDADLQHPPELLPELISHWETGADIVYTRRVSGNETGYLKRLTSRLFYRLLNRLSGLGIAEGAADFRLLDRKVVDVIRSLPETNLFLRGFVSWCGFRVVAFDYLPGKRLAGESKYSMARMLAFGLQGITQFSIKPLRLASFLGFASAFSGVIYGCVAAWEYFFGARTVSGWTSVIISILIIGGVQLVVLGIIGEYLGRTFLQTKQRPDYIIRERG